MHSMSPDMARLLVTLRLEEAELRRQRRTARAAAAPKIPRQRRGSGLLGRIVPGTGVRGDTR